MCGIAGYFSKDRFQTSSDVKDVMRKSILYRGRDENGEWTDEKNVHLFHSRLSIIDLSTGQQPMKDQSGRYVIVFNGEIYNYKELRADYESQGARFQTQSDTEVILAGYALKGERVCDDLNGMFAFAIWDTVNKDLFLARDHLGKKPLYWTNLNNTFYFSSTIDSFFGIPGWDKKISRASIALYSFLGQFPETATIFENVFSLPPASSFKVTLDQLSPRPKRYWRMNFEKRKMSLAESLDKYESLLLDATSIRLRSDVPLALSFSGGVDSGTLAALCKKKFNKDVHCFTIDYHTKENPSEETLIAEQVAKHLGLNWEFILFDYKADLLSRLPAAYQYYDQPSNQLPLVYSLELYKAMKSKVTVVLSGNGADELFTGYIGQEKIRQRDFVLKSLFCVKPFAKLAMKFFPKNGSVQKSLSYLTHSIPDAYGQRLLNRVDSFDLNAEQKDQAESTVHDLIKEASLCGVNSLLDIRMFVDLFCGTVDANFRLPDISGLQAQVEVRSPFLDYRLVEFAAQLPHQYKIGNLFSHEKNKFLPKVYYEKYVPHDIVWSQKKGMGYNLRWDLRLKTDPAYLKAFDQSYQTIESSGLEAHTYRTDWDNFVNNRSESPESMLTGFMLGTWLDQKKVHA